MADQEMKCSWKEIESIIDSGNHIVLYGPPGTGKTRGATKKQDITCYSVTLTMETPAAELRGHYVPKGTEFIWHDGPALRAWREGGRLVLNEVDQASGDALTFLHAILDDPEVARLTLPTGETVVPKPGFQAIATTNAQDLAMVLPEALLDRFSVRIFIDQPHPDALKALKNSGLASLVSATINAAANKKVTLRQAMAFQKLSESVPKDAAARAVFGNAADPALLASVLKVA